MKLWEYTDNSINSGTYQTGGDADPNSVLVIVDVQNCFMTGGSFLGHSDNSSTLPFCQSEKEALVDAITQIEEIETLIDNNTHIVFTRDYHPVNHMSMSGFNGDVRDPDSDPRKTDFINVFPIHCRNSAYKCQRDGSKQEITSEPTSRISIGDLIKKIIARCAATSTDDAVTKIGEFFAKVKNNIQGREITKIKGSEISYLFAGTKYFNEYFDLLGKTAIGLIPGTNEINVIKDTFDLQKNQVDGKGKKFVHLTKGEHCDKESYSAFNYHLRLKYKKLGSYDVESESIKASKDESTGLCEYLEKVVTSPPTIKICGLVGNICVINTACQGYIMTHLPSYPKLQTSKFIYSMSGTRWATPLGHDRNPKITKETENNDKHALFLREEAIKASILNDNKIVSFNVVYGNVIGDNFLILTRGAQSDADGKSYTDKMKDLSVRLQLINDEEQALIVQTSKNTTMEDIQRQIQETQTGGEINDLEYKAKYLEYKQKYRELKKIKKAQEQNNF